MYSNNNQIYNFILLFKIAKLWFCLYGNIPIINGYYTPLSPLSYFIGVKKSHKLCLLIQLASQIYSQLIKEYFLQNHPYLYCLHHVPIFPFLNYFIPNMFTDTIKTRSCHIAKGRYSELHYITLTIDHYPPNLEVTEQTNMLEIVKALLIFPWNIKNTKIKL